jgi:Tol biopolymer transport system component
MSWSDVHCSFDLSRSGNLVYEAPRAGADLGRLVLVARDGTVEPVTDEIADFFSAIPSLDGRKISVAVRLPDDGFEQRILDLASGSKSRPAQSGSTAGMRWVPPDGREVLFYSDRFEGRGQMFIQPEDGSAPAEQLWPSEQAHRGLDVSADGQQVILTNPGAPGFFVLDRRTGKVRTVAEDGTVLSAAFSPDGDWIVYARSDDKGTRNLWRVPFPGPGEPRQITFDDDDEPIWSIGGDEIYYRGPGHIMAIPVQKSGNDLVTGKARSLFEDHFRRNPFQRGIQNYRQHPDGRLLMIEPADTGEQSLVLVLNWRAKVVQAFADGDGS